MRAVRVYEVNDDRNAALALTALRVAIGAIFIVHGWDKLADVPGTTAAFERHAIPSPAAAVYLAILGELFGGLGIALGALTPLAAMGPVLVMTFAISFVHAEHGLLATDGGWEYPLVLLLVSLYFVVHGPGPFSLDALVARIRRRGPRRSRRVAATPHP